MGNEEKIAMLEEIMDVDEGSLTMDTLLNDLEEWDSLSKLSLIALAKQKFGLTIRTEVIEEFNTIRDVCDYLK